MIDRLTVEDLNEIEATIAGTTQGVWTVEPGWGIYADSDSPVLFTPFAGGQHERNARFAASARDNVPRLIHEVRALIGERNRLAAEVRRLSGDPSMAQQEAS